MTLMNNLGFNLCVAPWSLVIKWLRILEMERSCQRRGSKEVNEEIQIGQEES